MSKSICMSLAVVALVLIGAMPGFAWWRGGVWVAPVPFPYYPYPYFAPPVVQQPVVIQQQAPDVYIQPAPQQQAAAPGYWYYCQDAKAYFPYVRQCPGGWMKVVPTPPTQQLSEPVPTPPAQQLPEPVPTTPAQQLPEPPK